MTLATSSSSRDLAHAALGRAIKAVGTAARLAQKLGITAQALSQWDKVPPLRVLDVEHATGVSRHELRPDLYPVGRESPKRRGLR